MPMLPEEIKQQVKEAFADIKNPVKLVIFTQTLECMYCRENRELLQEIANLDDRFEAGDISKKEYERLRAETKARLIELMRE